MTRYTDILSPLEQEGSQSVVRAWLCEVGAAVKRDEPIVELETDKVAVEVAAPADGVLAEIALEPGAEAPPGALLGRLRDGDGPAQTPAPTGKDSATSARKAQPDHDRLSPAVRRLLAEAGVDPADITGTGRDGRITLDDATTFIESRDKPAPAPDSTNGVRRVPHDAMRKSIAEHMTRSVTTAPHVTAVFEADFSAVMAHRKRHKATFEKQGAPLTYSAYIVLAAAEAMKTAPNVNSRWRDDCLEVFDDVNIGVGVALGDKGLIAPVIVRAQTLSLLEAARRLGELTDKARASKLAPADVQNGTFTISNHGVSGSLIAAPIIINQPQSAILGVGKLEKRAVVCETDGADTIEIRPMAYVSLTIDHRALDGHQTNAWLTRFVETIETWPLDD